MVLTPETVLTVNKNNDKCPNRSGMK